MQNLARASNTIMLVHLLSSALKNYEEEMFIILCKLLVINAFNNPPLSVKHPAICRSTVITEICEVCSDFSSLNKVAAWYSVVPPPSHHQCSCGEK